MLDETHKEAMGGGRKRVYAGDGHRPRQGWAGASGELKRLWCSPVSAAVPGYNLHRTIAKFITGFIFVKL
jgi:hypothetical protein